MSPRGEKLSIAATPFLVWALAGAAWASGGGTSSVAISGGPAPGTATGTYAFFGTPSASPGGVVAFQASVENATASSGVFLHSEETQSAVVLEGDPAPGTGAGTYSGFGDPSLNGLGEVAFLATLTGGAASRGIIVDSGATQTAVALQGDPAPGTGDGTYSSFGDPSINGSGEVVFFAFVTGGTASRGIFLVGSGGEEYWLEGDAAPGTGGGTYAGFGDHSLAASGEVAFFASVTGGTTSAGIFLDSGGTETPVALVGDPAPGTGGGTYAGFGDPSLNGLGEVAFLATVTGGTASRGIFIYSGGTHTAVALEGDPAPKTGGGAYSFFGSPFLGDSGDVAFRANISGGALSQGVFVDSGGTQRAVALEGEPAPDSGGGSYSFFDRPLIGDSGAVIFRANITGGAASQGIFAAAPASGVAVPALSIHGLLLFASALSIVGAIAAGSRAI